MLRSKALKRYIHRNFTDNFETFGFWRGLYWTFIYPPIRIYERYKERIGRTIAYARLAWLHYDFDSAYLWDIMAFKLKRILYCLENGHAVQEKEDLDALKEAISICERLFNEDYDDKYHRAHDAKWGEMLPWDTSPNYDDKGKVKTYSLIFKDRPNVKTEEDKVVERNEFRECWVKGEEDRLKDIDRLHAILKLHVKSWWD